MFFRGQYIYGEKNDYTKEVDDTPLLKAIVDNNKKEVKRFFFHGDREGDYFAKNFYYKYDTGSIVLNPLSLCASCDNEELFDFFLEHEDKSFIYKKFSKISIQLMDIGKFAYYKKLFNYIIAYYSNDKNIAGIKEYLFEVTCCNIIECKEFDDYGPYNELVNVNQGLIKYSGCYDTALLEDKIDYIKYIVPRIDMNQIAWTGNSNSLHTVLMLSRGVYSEKDKEKRIEIINFIAKYLTFTFEHISNVIYRGEVYFFEIILNEMIITDEDKQKIFDKLHCEKSKHYRTGETYETYKEMQDIFNAKYPA